jgi:POT family proton-dependent oligopeptide transporter
LIVALTPGIAYLWTVLDRRGIKVRATDKMVVGFLLTAVCMAVMAYAGFRAGPGEGEKVTVAWQMLAYLALTVAEILISVTGLELAFVAAPKNMKSFVTGMWLASVGLANLFLNVPVTQLYSIMNPGIYFAMLAAALVAVALAFIFVAKRFNRLVEMEKAVEEEQGPEFPPVSPTSENIQTPRDQIKRNI